MTAASLAHEVAFEGRLGSFFGLILPSRSLSILPSISAMLVTDPGDAPGAGLPGWQPFWPTVLTMFWMVWERPLLAWSTASLSRFPVGVTCWAFSYQAVASLVSMSWIARETASAVYCCVVAGSAPSRCIVSSTDMIVTTSCDAANRRSTATPISDGMLS